MTYPAGPLPNAGQIADMAKTTRPAKSLVFVHGGSDVDFTDPANGFVPCATDFYCTVAGNLIAQLPGDSIPRTFPVTVGQVLTGLFTQVKGSSTADGIFRQ